MSEFVEKFVRLMKEDVASVDSSGDTFPYVEKLAQFFGLEDAADLYAYFARALEYEDVENLEKQKDLMDDWEYEISKMFFDKFGKMDPDFTDSDLQKFGSNREEYEKFHNSLH